jgi:hypothetical protein
MKDSRVGRRTGFVPPAAATRDPILAYEPPPRPRKSLLRRTWNWVRYHVEDRVGNAIMFGIGVIGIMLIILFTRPGFIVLLIRLLHGGDN